MYQQPNMIGQNNVQPQGIAYGMTPLQHARASGIVQEYKFIAHKPKKQQQELIKVLKAEPKKFLFLKYGKKFNRKYFHRAVQRACSVNFRQQYVSTNGEAPQSYPFPFGVWVGGGGGNSDSNQSREVGSFGCAISGHWTVDAASHSSQAAGGEYEYVGLAFLSRRGVYGGEGSQYRIVLSVS